MNSKKLIKEMQAAGWKLDRVVGSHHQFKHPNFGHSVTVPHPRKDITGWLLNVIRKQAHLK